MIRFEANLLSHDMMYKFAIWASLVLAGVLAYPVKDDLMFEGPDDTAIVESTVRETRAAPKHIGDLLKPGTIEAPSLQFQTKCIV